MISESESHESIDINIPIDPSDYEDPEMVLPNHSHSQPKFKLFGFPMTTIVWSNIFLFIVIHILAVCGFFYAILTDIKWFTILFAFFCATISGFGITVGSHRLWAHRSFKARWPLKLLLMIFQTMSLNGSIFSYARDHRTHHKFTETEADPKNSSRGFFFAHMGWWCLRKRPEVLHNGKKVNVNDLLEDPFVYYQNKFYIPLAIIVWGVIPTLIPYYLWNENLLVSHLICVHLRCAIGLHHYFTVNSIAHFWGYRPYDAHIWPAENSLVSYLSLGEGSHNYHHIFPYDYSTSLKGWMYGFNPSTLFIDCASFLGFAYDLKKPSPEVVKMRVNRTGKPDEYCAVNKSICKVIFYSISDWICGIITATWILWLGICVKFLCIGILYAIDNNT